jgi:murein DD-endopeptidase MepM/ murein hydrolase activator NlpD
VTRHAHKLVVLLGLFVLAVFVRNAPETERALGAVPDQLAMPLRLLKLQAQEPDQHLLMPVRGVRKQRVANTWGAPRTGQRKHQGQDIFARKGTPVVSATEGVVVRKGNGGLGGITVTVFGPGGRFYYYAHLDRWAEPLEVGDPVEPGTVLGYVGNTGNARTTPPHLHFGLYTREGAIDPLPLLRNELPQPVESD